MVNSSSPPEPSGLDLSLINHASSWDRVASDYAGFIAEHAGRYAADALRLAKISEHDEVLDVATGPGTLALQAARITRVHALDFSAQMLEALRQQADEQQLANLSLQQGDGQALPYADASFDLGFSMFGLFLFPDRGRGFAELARVLRPGARAVVASWQPQDRIVAFTIVNSELGKEIASPSSGGLALADPDVFEAEMREAGFEVEIHPVVHVLETPSLDALWEGIKRSHVALAIAADQLEPGRFDDLCARIRVRLERELGSGRQEVEMPAWLALGRRR
ncbi:Demethylrebeccamycin-D-glucose O-methyltransferase [Enhygromyxa salina]|uniref:Demethylrebeccamycin-D-glucose O-methyltransferase n=1 Tax=Enhygromyxa salina TaxID=215803 RepID=A0A2S9YFM2_9BACT|nr:methyltransferase domain-containing protein [Enhygromyxa salina]PRQ03841.1 Demethylrebeccamycin-D-glucose O-methyltransferase [Enhygromyxa salina]